MSRTSKLLVVILALLAALVLVAPALPGGAMGPGMMWDHGVPYFGTPGWRFFGSGWAWGLALGLRALTMLAFWGVIAVGIVLLVRWWDGRNSHEPHA